MTQTESTPGAAAPMQAVPPHRAHRFTLGAFEVTTLLAGAPRFETPYEVFGASVSEARFREVAQAHDLPSERLQNFFTPTLVHTGAELVLFDAGLSAETITGALATAGYAPEQIDTVVLTHMHGDHVGGLLRDGAPTMPNARVVAGRTEYEAWAASDDETFTANVAALSERLALVEDGEAVAAGITAVAAFGHTAGHLAFRLESAGAALMLTGDAALHPVFSLAHPDWELAFDTDGAQAVATRRRLFARIADEGVPFIGYHMPFPAVGYVVPDGAGFRYIPESAALLRG